MLVQSTTNQTSRKYYSIISSLFFIVVMMVACSPQSDTTGRGVRLVAEVTVTAMVNEVLPTLIVTDTPVRTPEIVSPLERVTVDAAFVLVTPTLPPSKTPTQTPTQTQTPTITPTPANSATPNATALLFPTSVIVPITQAVAAPINEICESSWFWIEPRPPACPLNAPTASQGVFQQFQNGYMVWVEYLDIIYVMYNDGQSPRWSAYRDYFVEGMIEETGNFENAPAPQLWQPRRGFGLLWRTDTGVRNRIGWSVQADEQPYSTQVQRSTDGTIYISQPAGLSVFALFPNGANWDQYVLGANDGIAPQGGVPLGPNGAPLLPTVRPPGL